MMGECGRRRSRHVAGWGQSATSVLKSAAMVEPVTESAMRSVGGRVGASPSRSWVVAVLLPRREYRRYQKHAEWAEAEANSRSVLGAAGGLGGQVEMLEMVAGWAPVGEGLERVRCTRGRLRQDENFFPFFVFITISFRSLGCPAPNSLFAAVRQDR